MIFNCSGGRAGESLLGELLRSGAAVRGISMEDLGKSFQSVVFCTNVTYIDGGFKGGKLVHHPDFTLRLRPHPASKIDEKRD